VVAAVSSPAVLSTPAASPPGGSCTLGAVIDALGGGVVRVVTAPRGLDVPVGEPVVHDPLAEPAPRPDDLLLAVGVEPHRSTAVDLVRLVGQAGAVAVLLKDDGELPAGLVAAAEASGVALLVAPQGAAWGQLHTLLRTARSASAPRGPGALRAPLGDLFGLADALAASVGGAVTIEDERSTVLAYSTGPHPTDEARRAAILGRPVPEMWRELLRERGVFRQIITTDDVVSVPRLDELASAPRLVVGVRAGGEALGSVWVQEGDRPFDPGAEQALRDTAWPGRPAPAARPVRRGPRAPQVRRRAPGGPRGTAAGQPAGRDPAGAPGGAAGGAGPRAGRR
jgi:hypothetical protein